MKIGILTYHSVPNFGANLQAYSTVGYLRLKGYDPIVINWVAKEIDETYGKDNPVEQVEAHDNFVKEYLPLSELCRTAEEVADVIKKEDISRVLIGSDIVLQHKPLISRIKLSKRGIKIKPQRSDTKFPNPFWGSFIPLLDKNVPVSLMSAASNNLPYKLVRGKLKKDIGESLLQFQNVYVRDEPTRELVSYFSDGKLSPEISPDPVFHFNYNCLEVRSKKDVLDRFNLPEKYILFSFRDSNVVTEEWLGMAIDILKEKGITGVLLAMPGGVIFNSLDAKVIGIPLNPIDWYYLIKYSSGYIGENMHPVVVALHNAVPFFSFDDYGKIKFRYKLIENTSKIYSIVAKSGFKENRISTIGKKYIPPAPKIVIEFLEKFDIEKCQKFSFLQQQSYEAMMNSILEN